MSKSASTGRQRSDSKAVQGILKKETRPSLSSADSSEAKENADIPSSEWEGLAGALGWRSPGGRSLRSSSKKEPPETKKLEVLPEGTGRRSCLRCLRKIRRVFQKLRRTMA